MGDWLDEWGELASEFMSADTFSGEAITWTYADGTDVSLTAIVLRGPRGRAAMADGTPGDALVHSGEILIARSDAPLAAEFDSATIPVSPGSATTETVAIGAEIEDHGNGLVTYAYWRESDRVYSRRSIEAQ